jgi:dTDP-4-amino-4,6-dideoxygalactose transaminase
MRGKVADMDAIAGICKRHYAVLLEDCAHSRGVNWRGRHTGHEARACAISSQSYKMINSGDGAFFLTDDPEMATKCAIRRCVRSISFTACDCSRS